MARPKGSRNKTKEVKSEEAAVGEYKPSVETDEPEFYDPDEEKGEPVNYGDQEENEKRPEGLLKARPGERLFESPGGCIHAGPDNKPFIFCKEERINIRPKREGGNDE